MCCDSEKIVKTFKKPWKILKIEEVKELQICSKFLLNFAESKSVIKILIK